jgi:hypothetical protein
MRKDFILDTFDSNDLARTVPSSVIQKIIVIIDNYPLNTPS